MRLFPQFAIRLLAKVEVPPPKLEYLKSIEVVPLFVSILPSITLCDGLDGYCVLSTFLTEKDSPE